MKLTYKDITISGPKRHEKQIKEYMEYIKAHYFELLDKTQKKMAHYMAFGTTEGYKE